MTAKFQSRPMAIGYRGAASTPHLRATEAAIAAMRAGGNAVDAAVTAAAVATVAQPFTSSVGGVGWASVYDAASGTTEVLQFLGAVPHALDPTALSADKLGLVDWRRLEESASPLLGSLTPSVVPGWQELLARRGSWSLARALEPAIALADEGVPVSELLAANTAITASRLRRWPQSAAIFLEGGEPRRVGTRLVQADLAATLQRVAANGAAEMVEGRTGRAILDLYRDHGGALRERDLREVRPTWHPPLVSRFRDHVVHATPTAFGDVAFVCGLELLDGFSGFAGPLDPHYVHLSIESAKLVSADRARYLGAGADGTTLARVLSPEHRARQRSAITDRAGAPQISGAPHEDTITLTTVDGAGNAVHLMQTVGTFFGTGAVVPGTGVLMNSSLYFAYAGAANRIVPGLPIEQNPCLAMVFDGDGRLRLVAGSPGGKARVETVRQLIVNVLDFGMNVQQAVDTGRFLVSPDGASVDFEARYGDVDPGLRQALEARGHVVLVKEEAFGSGQAIAIDPATGALMAGADWRRESVALAY
jgi:gamma-glutamyltranspeptidase/glutathione hydrolase